ncbi:hypothetical protein DI005_22715 [Prauserella sp. PE36]|uniref:TetR/AcrR family transcriptional regulator n=1 Tax=Prauserella endophytica TaxID=1592324 RepID=A0ABY2S9B2_9PSEU|nr:MULTISPECIES: TetR/AcrR family transcriptional regulator [Prauserella]PXY23132.1 hypothetical protein BAY59_25815 [Prauserella coralliicola]RBM17110.1 hypothetical protein DI005_22715 [Prauserella sp. PE36]TKG72475.1 TetR/AcrR family transcriptional regulator [Prauserella endophytica]
MRSERGQRDTPRRRDLIEIATELISEIGYEQTTVRLIADRMGIKSGSLYSHISSKEDVLYKIILDVADDFLERADRATEGVHDPEERLRARCRSHLEMIRDRRPAVRVYFDEWRKLGDANQAEVIRLRERYEDGFRLAIADGVESKAFDADPQLGARVLLSTLNWAPSWYVADGKLSPREVADQLLEVILHGLYTRG